MTSREWVTSAEAATILEEVGRRTLTRWITAGRLPAEAVRKMPGIRGPYLLDRMAVEELKAELDAARRDEQRVAS